MKVTQQQLKERQSWPLDMKLEYFCKIYSQFIIHMKGDVYLSFSGGKDSSVGIDICKKIHDGTFRHITPNWERVVKFGMPPIVFSNTGLEYPEIVDYAKKENPVIIKPKMGFTRVISEIGVALVSKEVAQKIREIRTTKSKKLLDKRLNGDAKGIGKLPEKWKYLIDAPFDISEKCCNILKKEPFKRYEKETGRRPVVFTTVDESELRKFTYHTKGCNTFDEGKEKSRPYSIFNTADTWEYSYRFKLKFADVYYDRVVPVKQLNGSVEDRELKAMSRTGCAFCMFGVHMEDKTKNNRFQSMSISHPKFHDIVINKCGLGKVLDFMKIPYYPLPPRRDCGEQTKLL